MIWTPIARQMPKTVKRIIVSPDSELARIPWQLLAAETHQELTQIVSPRALASLRRTRMATTVPERILLVGAVNYEAASQGEVDLNDWADLPETVQEVARVRELAVANHIDPIELSADEPTKAKVTPLLPGVAYVHLATHGFFFKEIDETRGPSVRNPLVASGIVLARTASGEADELSAEELLSSDLSAARLVTLSACDTGRGSEITGQGVLGLRAAVMAAGARSMLMSLWNVPDTATQLLMSTYYANLWAEHHTPSDALVRAQASVRDEPSGRFTDPIYWAGWVLEGEAW